MGWTDVWVVGRDGKGRGWWAVVFWLAMLVAFSVGLVSSYWHVNRGAAYALAAVSTLTFLWILTSPFRQKGQ